jgi:hypothetical protein
MFRIKAGNAKGDDKYLPSEKKNHLHASLKELLGDDSTLMAESRGSR